MRYIISGILAGAFSVAPLAASDLEIINIRVGQGDATLVQGPAAPDGNRVNVLIDAGDINDRDGGHILRAVLNKRGVEQLDFFVLTHDDADHIGGIVTGGFHGKSFVLGFDNAVGSTGDDDGDGQTDWIGREFFQPDPEELGQGDDLSVLNFVDYGDALMRDTQAIQKYQAIANTMGNRITIADQSAVDDFQIDLGDGARMIAYAANGFVRGRDERVPGVDRPNERSLSFLITMGDFDYLVSGDLTGRNFGADDGLVEQAVAASLIADEVNLDVLHVNHHGANNGSSVEFLELLEPEIAIISAGNRNSHKHPHEDVLQRLVEAGVDRIFQTSWGTTENITPSNVRDHQAIWQQDIIIRTDGEDYWIETSRKWDAE